MVHVAVNVSILKLEKNLNYGDIKHLSKIKAGLKDYPCPRLTEIQLSGRLQCFVILLHRKNCIKNFKMTEMLTVWKAKTGQSSGMKLSL